MKWISFFFILYHLYLFIEAQEDGVEQGVCVGSVGIEDWGDKEDQMDTEDHVDYEGIGDWEVHGD